MQILKPKKLKAGDTIGVIAPSGIVEAKGLEAGIRILKNWGFNVELGKHIFKKVDDYSAGTPQERREDFEKMVTDPKIKAIACAEGGYAASSVLLSLNPKVVESLKMNPPLFFGFSDFCIFLNANFSMGIVGVHAPNLVGLSSHNKFTQKFLKKVLFGEMETNYGPSFFTKVLIPGKAEGYFLPTNLETLTHLFGSKFDPLENFEGPIILALEEVWEEKSDVERMLEEIILHRCFDKVKAVLIGRIIGDSEVEYPQWGKRVSWHDLFVSLLKDKNIPVAEFPNFGHLEEQRKIFKILRLSRNKSKTIYGENLFLSLPVGVKAVFNALSDRPQLKFLEQPVQ